MNPLREGFGMATAISELDAALGLFDAKIGSGIDQYLSEVESKENEWAKKVEYWWKATAPHDTDNLKDAIDIDNDNAPQEIAVGVNVHKITARAGQVVKGKRTGRNVELPDYDYTEEAEAVNVSAKMSPHGAEEHIPFISQVWFAYAERAFKEIFE